MNNKLINFEIGKTATLISIELFQLYIIRFDEH